MGRLRCTAVIVVLAASIAAPAPAGEWARSASVVGEQHVKANRGPRGEAPLPARAGSGRTAALVTAIADVEAGRRTTPLIGEPGADGSATITFLVRRGNGPIPRIISDVTGWGERPDDTFDSNAGTMSRVGRTDWYCLDAPVAPRARIEYLIARGLRDYRLDPHNPRRTSIRGMSPASEFVMPDWVAPPEFEEGSATPAGRVVEATIDSRAIGGSRAALVYTPPNYPKDGEYPLIVFHGGTNVAESGVGPRVLDWLIAQRAITPVLAVFVDSWPRNDDETPAALRAFLTDELLAWVASRYAVSADAGKCALLGISYGAKDVLDAAVKSDACDLVGLLIPGRRLTAADITALVPGARHRMRVAVLAALYDAPNLPTARRIRTALIGAGHAVNYLEVPEGHNQGTWRNHLADVLVSLFGTRR